MGEWNSDLKGPNYPYFDKLSELGVIPSYKLG